MKNLYRHGYFEIYGKRGFMHINQIHFSAKFPKLLVKLPNSVQDRFYKKVDLFVANQLHPSLRLHKLT